MVPVKPLNHSHDLPPPNKKGRTYICSCTIFLRPTAGAKLVLKTWIGELEAQPWSRAKKANDQPAFNWALMKTAQQVDLYLLPQAAFPTGGLYFKNKTWVKETHTHVIIHNNYILGFEKKIKRFHDYVYMSRLLEDYDKLISPFPFLTLAMQIPPWAECHSNCLEPLCCCRWNHAESISPSFPPVSPILFVWDSAEH